MIEYVNRISISEKNERYNAIIQILEEKELPYEIIHQNQERHWVNNIIIPINRKAFDKRFVLCAHYDNFDGSCGANDNASGVSILIALASKMIQSNLVNCYDIVLFDREEVTDRGSEQYITYLGADNILGAINFDTCGYGNRILLGPTKNSKQNIFDFITKECLQKYNIELIEITPGSDDRSFEEHHIPNLSVCVVPETDIDTISKIIDYEVSGKNILDCDNIKPPEFIKTVHNGEWDRASIIEKESLEIVLDFASEIITLQNK
ncbi:M28 family peptidase [Paludicola sp. MB14-C6]|uniref:M28 family metallopeptidase n=1 Tax=Paludihabitans sp. MB14-C6 TaxID=3070656 RepID=UPI0027DC6E8F|nr:M28 family peptidase [Paludicola sp. MB14-C6]WMJ22745.1 M28 family peptidase [Paludicola sp. MB14-C6]